MSVSDRGLERLLLRNEALTRGKKPLQLLAVLVRHPLSPQDEGKRGGARGGQRRPHLADTPREHALPGEDGVVLRQAPKGPEPIPGLSQGGVSRRPHRRGIATNDGIIIVADLLKVAGRKPGVDVHHGIIIVIIVTRRSATVDADGRDSLRAEGLRPERDALRESRPVHEPLLSRKNGAGPMPAEAAAPAGASASAWSPRGDGGTRTGAWGEAPAEASRAAILSCAAAKASSCC